MKTRADSLVSIGTDIPNAAAVFCFAKHTTIKLFLFSKEAVASEPPVPSIMRINQAVIIAHGERHKI